SDAREQIRQKQQVKADERKDISARLEILSDLEHYNGTAVSDQQVAQAKKAIQSDNARTLEQYVDKELADLAAKHPELTNGAQQSATDRIIAQHNNATEKRLNQGDTESRAALQDLYALNEATLKKTEAERQALEQSMAADPGNEELKKKSEKLK